MDSLNLRMCKVDSNRVFTGESTELRPVDNIQEWVLAEPPEKGKPWKHTIYGWVEYEPPKEQPRKNVYSRIEFIDALDKAGLADTLGVLLTKSPIIIREQWYANSTINITDPRVVAFFQIAGIDLSVIFK